MSPSANFIAYTEASRRYGSCGVFYESSAPKVQHLAALADHWEALRFFHCFFFVCQPFEKYVFGLCVSLTFFPQHFLTVSAVSALFLLVS